MEVDVKDIGVKYLPDLMPKLLQIDRFRRFDRLKTTGMKTKRKVCWVVWYLVDPDCQFSKHPFKARLEQGLSAVDADMSFYNSNKSWITKLCDAYVDAFMTPAERTYSVVLKKLDELSALIEALEVTEETAGRLGSLIKTQETLLSQVEKWEKRVHVEKKDGGAVFGNKKESLGDLGLV